MTQLPFPSMIDALVANARRSAEQIADRADQQLRVVVRNTYEHVPFYRDHWKSSGFSPDDFSGRQDLPAIPLIDKDMIVSAEEDALDSRLTPQEMFVMSTSGTSGRAIHVRRTLLEMRAVRRGYLRSLLTAGARPWHRVLTMASPWLKEKQGSFVGKIVKTHHLLPLDSPEEQIASIESFKPDGLIGQTGGLYLLAREIVRRGKQFPLAFLCPTGATLMPEMAQAMRDAFGTEPRDLYGAVEVGGIAWQCPQSNYHIDADRVVFEVVDEVGSPVPAGTPGQAVVTALYQYAMPIIRYRLLDITAISTRTCDCARHLPLMERVQGRVNDFLPAPSGELVSPHFFFHLYDHAKTTPVKEWRIIQNELADLTYEYVPEEHFNSDDLRIGMDMIHKKFGQDATVRAVEVASIPMTSNGKRTCIISKLRSKATPAYRPWIQDEPVMPLPDDQAGVNRRIKASVGQEPDSGEENHQCQH